MISGKTCKCHCTCSTPRMCKAAGSMPKLQPAITNKWTTCARNASASLCDSIFVPFLEARSCNTDVQGYYTSQRPKNCITAEEGPDVHCVHEMEFNNNSHASQTSLGHPDQHSSHLLGSSHTIQLYILVKNEAVLVTLSVCNLDITEIQQDCLNKGMNLLDFRVEQDNSHKACTELNNLHT